MCCCVAFSFADVVLLFVAFVHSIRLFVCCLWLSLVLLVSFSCLPLLRLGLVFGFSLFGFVCFDEFVVVVVVFATWRFRLWFGSC